LSHLKPHYFKSQMYIVIQQQSPWKFGDRHQCPQIAGMSVEIPALPSNLGTLVPVTEFRSYNNPIAGRLRMRVVIGSDHAGFEMKKNIVSHVRALGHQVQDVGTDSTVPVDYPDYAEAVGTAITSGEADRGILICGSGVGAVVAANKIPGIRAGVCHDCYSAHQGVEHDDMNVLVLGARVIAPELAHNLVWLFLGAEFTREERHLRRLAKIQNLEDKYRSGSSE
jgi:ribose 5-phosphate isomerase B